MRHTIVREIAKDVAMGDREINKKSFLSGVEFVLQLLPDDVTLFSPASVIFIKRLLRENLREELQSIRKADDDKYLRRYQLLHGLKDLTLDEVRQERDWQEGQRVYEQFHEMLGHMRKRFGRLLDEI